MTFGEYAAPDAISQDGIKAYEIKFSNNVWSLNSHAFTQALNYRWMMDNNINGIKEVVYVFVRNPINGKIGFLPTGVGEQWLFDNGFTLMCLR